MVGHQCHFCLELCPNLPSIAVIKTLTKQPVKQSCYYCITFRSHFIIEGRQVRNLSRNLEAGTKQRPWRSVAYWLTPMVCSACFWIEPRTASPEMALPTMDGPLMHQLLFVQEDAQSLVHMPSLIEAVSKLRLPLPRWHQHEFNLWHKARLTTHPMVFQKTMKQPLCWIFNPGPLT